jgi:hypothetical protein
MEMLHGKVVHNFVHHPLPEDPFATFSHAILGVLRAECHASAAAAGPHFAHASTASWGRNASAMGSKMWELPHELRDSAPKIWKIPMGSQRPYIAHWEFPTGSQ